ncbi:MAG TPA: circadian clock KaiB family protein [Planctomycetota bacterium]|nr:circadian clock KaiB family protein [Planctomycetota bacterium]
MTVARLRPEGATEPDGRVVLTLYVAGRAPASARAIANLNALIQERRLVVDLTIVDVLETPGAALLERILVTPTLMKTFPAPHTRVIGDLSDKKILLQGLGLPETI